MKFAIIISCAIIGILAQDHDHDHGHDHSHDHSHDHTPSKDNPILVAEEQMLHHIHDACQADPATYADHDLLHDLNANLDNPQIGAHMLCESKGVGLQNEKGELDIPVIREKISLSIKEAKKVDELIKECAIPKKTPEKTAIHLFMCMDSKGVIYFHGF